jgi:hypothetical protein
VLSAAHSAVTLQPFDTQPPCPPPASANGPTLVDACGAHLTSALS